MTEITGLRQLVEGAGTIHAIYEEHLFDVRHYYADGELQGIVSWHASASPWWRAVRCQSASA